MTNVVVCGGGLAGLSAALAAAEAGASVTLLEKAPQLGGTTLLSGGHLWTFADFEELRTRIPAGDPALQWLVYDTIEDGRAWLRSHGVRLGEPARILHHGISTEFDPAMAVARLSMRLEALGGKILLSTAMASISMRGSTVGGVVALRDSAMQDVKADAVILATGGFPGNQELISRYIVRDASSLALRASPWSTGDGFIAGLHVGAAASAGLHTFYGHALAVTPVRSGQAQFRDISAYQGSVCVALNLNGERFADESEETGEEALNQRLAQQPGGRAFYVTDAKLMDVAPLQGATAVTRSILDRIRKLGGVVLDAGSLEELCARMGEHGLPAGRALTTLRHYNEQLLSAGRHGMHPPRHASPYPIAAPPFSAVLVQAGITATTGGLQIDEHARVVWRAGSSSASRRPPDERAFLTAGATGVAIGTEYRQSAIRGLYAAGTDAGNISHFGYAGSLATALTTGRVAGVHAAALRSG